MSFKCGRCFVGEIIDALSCIIKHTFFSPLFSYRRKFNSHSTFLFRFYFEHLRVVLKSTTHLFFHLSLSFTSFNLYHYCTEYRVNCILHGDTILYIPPFSSINLFTFCPIRCQKYVSPQLDLGFVFTFFCFLQLFWSLSSIIIIIQCV